MTLLLSPIALKGIVARNRIVACPMSQYRSLDGSPSDWHVATLGRLAIGGAGIIFYEETAVEARGRKTHHCAGLWRQEQVADFRRIAEFLRGLGAVPAMQLGHAGGGGSGRSPLEGRGGLTGDDAARGHPPWETIAPSSVSARAGRAAPREMHRDDMHTVIAAWATAASRALEAGFDILEIHGAHGYLLHQFLSPLTNHRNDGYGGDIAGRMRFPLDVVEAVRAAWPKDKPLFYRMSVIDGRGGIWSIADSMVLAKALAERGVDLIDCSSGGLTGPTDMPAIAQVSGMHVPAARRIGAAGGLPVMAPGRITRPDEAEALLQSGDVALIGMGRELMAHADWPVSAARALGHEDPFGLMPPDFAFRLRARAEGVDVHDPHQRPQLQ
jgi:2,4-dienoyl-CoA reductase-like NADH-dependent reductase (Old Yellow Enzyme family)